MNNAEFALVAGKNLVIAVVKGVISGGLGAGEVCRNLAREGESAAGACSRSIGTSWISDELVFGDFGLQYVYENQLGGK